MYYFFGIIIPYVLLLVYQNLLLVEKVFTTIVV